METNELNKPNEHKRICPYCKQEYNTTIGLQNVKNLFRRPTLDDCITLFIILMVLFAYWAYNHDISAYKQVIGNLNDTCALYYTSLAHAAQNVSLSQLNFSLAGSHG